jgi:hypothetical protein
MTALLLRSLAGMARSYIEMRESICGSSGDPIKKVERKS